MVGGPGADPILALSFVYRQCEAERNALTEVCISTRQKKPKRCPLYVPCIGRWYDYYSHGFWSPFLPLEGWLITPFSKFTLLYRYCPWRVELTDHWIFDRQNSSPFDPMSPIRRFVMALRKVGPTEPEFREISDSASVKRWPELWEYLTAKFYDEKRTQPRLTATITLYRRDDGFIGATLNDKDNARVAFAVGETLLGLLDSLEAVVSNPKTVWRNDRDLTGNAKRQKKG